MNLIAARSAGMHRLKLFAGLELELAHGAPLGRAGQPRRLALLALLALSRDRSLRRDKIVALFWPDRSFETTRPQLSSVIYDLRAALGEDALAGTGNTIALRLDQVEIDVVRFEEAIRAERWAEAVALYRGPLLDGVDLAGSVELERLIDQRRDQFSAQYALALEREGERLAAAGDDAAIGYWQRLVSVRPYDGSSALHLMVALHAKGDRAGALEQAARYCDRLAQDLDAEPEAAVVAFVNELRRTPAIVTRIGSAESIDQARADGMISTARLPSDGAIEVLRRPRRRLGRLTLGFAATVILIAGLVALRPRRHSLALVPRVAVFPFVAVGDSQYRFLGDGVPRLLSTVLDDGGGLSIVRPLPIDLSPTAPSSTDVAQLGAAAARLGADQFITGTAVGHDDRIALKAVLHLVSDQAAPGREFAVEGNATELPRLIDRLTTLLLVADSRPVDRLTRIAAATTSSVPALKEYLRGDRWFREGAYADAASAFDRATQLDPTFAVAHYRCSLATLWADLPATSTDEHDAQALRYAQELAPHDRDLILAYGAWRRGDAVEAERRYQLLWARYHDDAEIGFQLAETWFHYGPLVGRPVEDAAGVLREVLRIDSTHRGARWHLALVDALASRTSALMTEIDGLALTPTDLEARGLARRLHHQHLGVDPAFRTVAPGKLWSLGWRLGVNLRDFGGADEAFRIITDGDPNTRIHGYRGRALLRLAEGQWDAGLAYLRAAELSGADPAAVTLAGLLANGVFHRPRPEIDALRSAARTALAAIDSAAPAALIRRTKLTLAIGQLSIAMEDSVAVLAERNALKRLGDSAGAAVLDAALAAAAGRLEESLRDVDAARRTVWFGLAVLDPYYGQQDARFLRAEVLFKLGRLEEALRWYGTFGEFALDDLPFLARAQQRRREIGERLGRPISVVERWPEAGVRPDE